MREETILDAINDLDSINCMIQDIHESIYQDSPDYWTRLEHQAAIAAMQGFLSCSQWEVTPRNGMSLQEATASVAYDFAHALVEKYKEKEERK